MNILQVFLKNISDVFEKVNSQSKFHGGNLRGFYFGKRRIFELGLTFFAFLRCIVQGEITGLFAKKC